MPITYNSSTDLITVTNYTSGSPATPELIYQADLTNSWGKVTRVGQTLAGQNHYTYIINASLQIGDGTLTTFFYIQSGAFIILNTPTRTFVIKANAEINTGVLTNNIAPSLSADVRILLEQDSFWIESTGKYKQFGGSFFAANRVGREVQTEQGTIEFWYCDITAKDSFTKFSSNTFKYCYIHNASAVGIKANTPFTAFIGNTIASCNFGVQLLAGTLIEMIDTTFINNNNHVIANVSSNGTLRLVNPNIAELIISGIFNSSNKIQSAFTFDLTITGYSGDARAWIRDGQSQIVFNALTTGTIATQKLLYKEWSGTNGATVTNYSSHLLKIRKYGFFFISNNFTADKKLSVNFALIQDLSATLSETAAQNVTGVTVDFTNNTITFSGVTIVSAYCYVKWLLCQSSNMQYSEDFTTDGSGNYTLTTWTPIFNGNNALTGTGKIIATYTTASYINNGNTTLTVIDSTGINFRIYGLPTKSNSYPVIRIKKLSDNSISNPTISNGQCYVNLTLGESYEVRADARGYIASNFITINTNTSSELQITLEEILDSNNNPVYGNGIQQQKDLITYDNATNTISIAYDSNYPTISIFSAVDKLEEILATSTGLEIAQHPVYENGKLVFIRNILTNAQSTIKIKPAIGNTGDPELLFELVREGDEKPYNLFDFSSSNGKIIKYPTTVNVANFTGEVTVDSTQIANDVWSATNRTLTTYLSTDQNNKLNNLDVAVSTRLASSSYVQAPTTAQIKTDIESSTVLAKEATTASRASQTSVNLIPTNTLLTTDSRLNNLDTTISSRLSSNDYISPPTTTDIRNALPEINNLDVLVSSRSSQTSLNNKPNLTDIESSTVLAKQSTLLNIPTNTLLSTDNRLNTLDANISSRLASSSYVSPLTNTETITAVTNALNTKDVVTNTNLNTALDNIEINGLTTDQNNKLTQISNDVIRLAKLRGLSGISVIAKAPTNTEVGYLKTSDNDINLIITKVGDEEILSD